MTDIGPREALLILDIFRQGGDRPEAGLDIPLMAARLHCSPDVDSVLDSLRAIARTDDPFSWGIGPDQVIAAMGEDWANEQMGGAA